MLKLKNYVVLGAGILLASTPLRAQATKNLPLSALGDGTLTSAAPLGIPTQLSAGAELYGNEVNSSLSPFLLQYPKDSLASVIANQALQWLQKLDRRSIKGLQFEPAGRLAVAAGKESEAQAFFASQLAVPGKETWEKAQTLWMAIMSFGDCDYPNRISIAKKYLAQLDALGAEAAVWRVLGRLTMVPVYRECGQPSEVLAEARNAYALTPVMPFEFHGFSLSFNLYTSAAEVLATVPNGNAIRDSITRNLRNGMVPPPERLSMDPSVDFAAKRAVNDFMKIVAYVDKIGKPAAPVRANLWLNTSDTAQIRLLNDGRVYIVAAFGVSHPGGLATLIGLQRIQDAFGQKVGVIGFPGLEGHWGYDFVTPEEEAKRVGEFFQRDLKVTFPLGFWVGKKVLDYKGGMLPPGNPTIPTLGLNATTAPLLVAVIDTKGNLRRVLPMYDSASEAKLSRYISKLLSE